MGAGEELNPTLLVEGSDKARVDILVLNYLYREG